MGKTKLLSISFFFFHVLTTFGVVSVQSSCSGGKWFFKRGSTYEVNRFLALSYLASNVSVSNQDGFSTTWVGQGLNRVYALGMCIPGTEPDTCNRCIMSGSRKVIRSCPNQTEAFLYNHLQNTSCLVRYSNRPFGSLDLSLIETEFETNRDLPLNSTEFDMAWEALMLCAIGKASSVEHEPSSRAKYFAIDVSQPTSVVSMYAFVLCSKDISPWNCSVCLRRNVDDYSSCCRGKQGSIQRPSCFMRWDLFPFDGLFDTSSAPPPHEPLRLAPQKQDITTKKDGDGTALANGSIVATVVITVVIMALLALGLAVCKRRKSYQAFSTETADDGTTSGSLQFDFRAIKAATNNFHESSKLGQGGFGEVYKGKFPNGTEVAVKRMSKTSGQGEQEFKNEVLLVAKLQHRNLVRLLGFSVEGEKKILVYEFVPNKSLDYLLFDPIKRGQLDWTKRYNIIGGITRRILYLHQDSRLTIIHRDLKASNILLDADMNPKIADFGMARNFRVDQTEANTGRVVGTFGYMPPEYAANGHFSMKSDVYSFGVLILEIIGGKKNSSFHQIDGSTGNLVTHVWRLWNNEPLLELVDPAIGDNYDKEEVIRCIHIGLLCVQENPADRPTMSTIFQMLTNASITLPVPQPPGFFFRDRSEPNTLPERLLPGPTTSKSFACSVDDTAITSVTPR